AEQLDDRRLAGGDVAGEGDVQHESRNAEGGTRNSARRTPVPRSAFRVPRSEQRRLVLILPRHPMTLPAPRLVRLPSPDHDRGTVPQGGPAVDEARVAAR